MARLFDDGNAESLDVDAVPVATPPLTMAAWAYTDQLDNETFVIGIASSSDANEYFSVSVAIGGIKPVNVSTRGGGTLANIYTTTGATVNTWHHVCGVFNATDSRSAFIDGGGKATNTDTATPSNLDRMAIGRLARSAASFLYWSGSIAEAAIWNAALTDEEVAILAAGYSPLFVRPQNIIFYLPMIRDDDNDLVGGLNLTATNGPTISAHPRIIYPTSPFHPSITSLVGPINLLSVNAVTTANIKSINAVLIANVKSINAIA